MGEIFSLVENSSFFLGALSYFCIFVLAKYSISLAQIRSRGSGVSSCWFGIGILGFV